MPTSILKSVGASGRNLHDDVVLVQTLLTQRGISPGPIDGRCGPRTAHAILVFQKQFMADPDGRVDPNGPTWRHLVNGDLVPTSGLAALAWAGDAIKAAFASASVAPSSSSHGQSLTTLVPRPSRDSINHGLTAVTNAFMMQQLGKPRESFSVSCQPVTNALLRRNIVTQSVGPFSATGLRPAVDSLRNAFAQVKVEQPDVYAALGTAGMLCCRLQRGSSTAISNHSWGTAIDLKLNGVLDARGNNKVQLGLTLIASIMNQHGWYWGAAFRTEDAMHFEGSHDSILSWRNQLI